MGIGQIENEGFGLAVTLIVNIAQVITPEESEKLVAQTRQICPYSNAPRVNIEVTLIGSNN